MRLSEINKVTKNVFGARRQKRRPALHSHALERHGVLQGSLRQEAADDVVVAGGAQSGAASAGVSHQPEGFCRARETIPGLLSEELCWSFQMITSRQWVVAAFPLNQSDKISTIVLCRCFLPTV